jgi:hypothetical protein
MNRSKLMDEAAKIRKIPSSDGWDLCIWRGTELLMVLDLLAVAVLLLVERFLFLFGNVAVVL